MSYILEFRGPYYFLSNYYHHPYEWNGVMGATSEHHFQAAKALLPEDAQRIYATTQPNEAKKFGGRRYLTLRPDWDEIKDDVVLDIVRTKFQSSDKLSQRLLDTEDALLGEGNTWHDNYWGSCSCPKCANIKGRNQLGKILMKIRQDLS